MSDARIDYEPIFEQKGQGYIALSIYPPGTWMDEQKWLPFIGGCGVGRVTSLEAAKSMLFERAIAECDRHIAYGEVLAVHYRAARARLLETGLVEQEATAP